jgi:hypothetical protein
MIDDQMNRAEAGRPMRTKPVPTADAKQVTHDPWKALMWAGVADTDGCICALDLVDLPVIPATFFA